MMPMHTHSIKPEACLAENAQYDGRHELWGAKAAEHHRGISHDRINRHVADDIARAGGLGLEHPHLDS
jgi:hypothetical protein